MSQPFRAREVNVFLAEPQDSDVIVCTPPPRFPSSDILDAYNTAGYGQDFVRDYFEVLQGYANTVTGGFRIRYVLWIN